MILLVSNPRRNVTMPALSHSRQCRAIPLPYLHLTLNLNTPALETIDPQTPETETSSLLELRRSMGPHHPPINDIWDCSGLMIRIKLSGV